MSRMPPIAANGRLHGIALVAAFATAQALAAGFAAFATRDLFAALRDPGPLPTIPLVTIIVAGFAIGGFRIAARVVGEKTGQNYAAELRFALFDHLTKVSQREITQRRTGSLALRFVGDLTAIRGWVALGLSQLVSASIVLPAATLVLFLLDPRLGLAATAPIFLGLIIMTVVGWRIAPLYRRLRSKRARLAADMSERIPVAPELRLLGRMGIEEKNLRKRTDELVDAAVVRARSAAALRAIPDVVSALAGAAIFFAALRLGVPAPEVAGALAAVGLMVQPIRSISGVWDKHRSWRAACEKCEKLLALPRHSNARPRTPLSTESAPTLVFAGVNAGPLREIDVIAGPGKKIAIVGGNGAGKSTLLTLAAGLEIPDEGTVTVAGKPPYHFTAMERRRTLGLMSKSSPILAGSLRRTLTMGISERPSDSVIEARAVEFGLAKVLDRLGGLDGKVAEAGRNLSTGEVRRLMLTRVALSKAALILLDEPDDALDGHALELVMKALSSWQRTVLIVTHDLRVAQAMDEVWHIENGRIASVGTPDIVLAKGGLARGIFESAGCQSDGNC